MPQIELMGVGLQSVDGEVGRYVQRQQYRQLDARPRPQIDDRGERDERPVHRMAQQRTRPIVLVQRVGSILSPPRRALGLRQPTLQCIVRKEMQTKTEQKDFEHCYFSFTIFTS